MTQDGPAATPPADGAPTAPGEPILRLRRLAKSYGGLAVLRGIDLDIRPREFLTILGPSGSGKTTVLRLIGGFADPTGGEILFEGRDIAGVEIFDRPFNTVFQDYALFPHLTVAENVAFGLRVRRVPRSQRRARVAESLRLVGLGDLGSRYPAQLSGGQRQRVALARALICRPKVLLLDEPLGALDAELRRQMQGFLKGLQREVATTFLFVTHDQEEAITMSDRIVVMNRGGIEQVGEPAALYYRPASRFVATFFGENNLVPGRVAAIAGGRATLDTALGPLACEAPAGLGGSELAPGAAAQLAVRPECLHLLAAGERADNLLAARVAEVSFVGARSTLRLAADAAPQLALTLQLPSRPAGLGVAAGDRVRVGWSAADCSLVPDEAAP
ncbi:MAG: ABC transporter ATP-binding protein [Dongiaceae bacterium]